MILNQSSDYFVNAQTLGRTPIGGDTIFVDFKRTQPLRFQNIEGNATDPIVVINSGGQVKINGVPTNTWGALSFENCKYIKVSGAGHPAYKYGFELTAIECGLAFSELSTDCEAEFIKIDHNGFFGIMAKKDYGGNPPTPYPVFNNLIIHDCFIENVSEGMYLGETKSPGMEFRHVKIYNNIIRNTQRESIQIANMVEDVQIYNNTMLNAGTEGAIYHMNNLQIGGNSVVNAYNNIIMDAPVFGIINMGRGNCIITNNYVQSSQGIFCDNRDITDTLSPININSNYFKSITGNHIIRNMNELNYLTATDNKYDTNVTFYLDQTGVDNETISNNTLTTVAGIQFNDPANNDYALASGTASEYLGMGAPGGPEYFPHLDPALIPQQIIVTPNMVIDSVAGGSVNSPLLLFDEQSLNVDANEHAMSNSWKPDYAMNTNRYHAIVDLGNEYKVTEVNLHDMHGINDFAVEYLDTTLVWKTLFVEPLSSFNVWKKYITDATTRYLRFSMYDDVFAAVNEITIHGYPEIRASSQVVVTSSMITDLVPGGSVRPVNYLFDEQSVNVDTNEHPTSDSWKPYYNANNAPYHALVDLGKKHFISEINLHDMHDVHDFVVEYGDGTNWTELFTESCNAFNVWKRYSTPVATRYLRLTMEQSPFAAVNEIVINGYELMDLGSAQPDPDPQSSIPQIVVTSNMVTDLVPGGSVNSAQFLFDEQSVNPLVNDKPTSNSWKPYYNNTNAPYYITIDLQEAYHISKIYMHDMHDVHNFNVEYDDNGTWTTLFIESGDAFNTWKLHETNVDTQHLRLGMLNSPFAAFNEILLYGNPVSSTSKQAKDSTMNESPSEEGKNTNTDKIQLFPNPVKEKLYLQLPDQMTGNNEIRVIDVLGKLIYNQNIYMTSEVPAIELSANDFLSAKRFYVFSCRNESGEYQTIKFFKE